MLTVNHTDKYGSQFIYEAVNVTYDQNCCAPAGAEFGATFGSVHLELPEPARDGSVNMPFYDGMVYVMNSDGKTVAKYDLGGWPVPEKVTQTLSGPKGGMGLQGASAL